MPYVSKAQAAKFHVDPRLRKYAPEFDAASKGLKLPRHKKGKHHAQISRFVKRHHKGGA
jgi:hypothetical protein